MKRVLQNAALVALSALLTVGTAEAILRIAGDHVVADGEWLAVGGLFDTDDALLGYSLRPGARRLAMMGGDFIFTARINEAGFRDASHPVERTAGSRRILVLGDSFMFGAGVNEEETMSRRLEAAMPGTEVINTGVPGYDLGQEYLFYRARGRRYRPDVVLLAFFINDLRLVPELEAVDDAAGLPSAFRYRPEMRRKIDRKASPTRNPITLASRWLGDHSALYELVRRRLRPAPGPGNVPGANDVGVFRAEPDEATTRGWQRAYRMLDDLKRLATGDGSNLAIVLVPAPWQATAERWRAWVASLKVPEASLSRTRPQEMVTAWCERSATPCLDLREAFGGENVSRLYFGHDQHWTAEGHARAATAVARFLGSKALFGSPRGPS